MQIKEERKSHKSPMKKSPVKKTRLMKKQPLEYLNKEFPSTAVSSMVGSNQGSCIQDMMFLVSDNSSSIDSQDEHDLLIQEKILNHLVEPGKLF